jgi:hypothetical protein
MRLIPTCVFDAYTTQGALRRMRRIRRGVIGGRAHTGAFPCAKGCSMRIMRTLPLGPSRARDTSHMEKEVS